jgi:PHD/YefM family antitoxin component YafN of YafNO toxin-antitoxin module
MLVITANDLKTKGIPIIEDSLNNQDEAIITVRGKPRYVVMTMAHYDHLRDCELEAALQEVKADLAAGRFNTIRPNSLESDLADHMARVTAP